MRLPPTVLFHPDFNRRLRSCTESADPSLRGVPEGIPIKEKALAGLGLSALTAGGDFHPALRTYPPDMGGLFRIMTNREAASKNLPYGYYACAYDVRAKLCENPAGQKVEQGGTDPDPQGGHRHMERSRRRPIRFRFVLLR
ncbi:hypothetical protein BDS110ZK25_47440 [Bradyrhizobium diazoefficiens]|uniref:Uncharacterized protein n=1 Tax=Bradyrhizobium diazoefficiens TaxID=1355477 RepID=A0A809Y4A3_9BRAD|nr:hypothetical protein F07S3_81370 [Bradyrhizobium diazoefficiens]BCA07316.1 hypothetical protein H12S4_82200 [Bradyrhizobium diazoefficiens]BCA15989.1 hypothetical protein BDHF08_78360 [Bradyrhizobium diazoefficiens]BCA24667.1 hypothetical protein BDHH15_78820 [Bradyrhizobium diazoefficiens]BCE25407.1 hypothetical protein XF1B_80880 [Bradyrhizobium diazoefficiens]